MEEINTDDPTTHWGLVIAAAVGVLGVLVWCLSGRCSRQLQLSRKVEAEKTVLFDFLSDPTNLKIVHPYTTDIRIKSETEGEGGTSVKDFDWEEKIPFTVVSAVRMRCDPTTFTIILDIKPVGGKLDVQLKWSLKADNPESSELHEDDHLLQKSKHPQDSADAKAAVSSDSADDKSTTLSGSAGDKGTTTLSGSAGDKGTTTLSDSAGDKGTTTLSGSADDNQTVATSSADDKAVAADKKPRQKVTEFQNNIRVTGPGGAAGVFVFAMMVRSAEEKLMDGLQQYFKNASK